MDDLIKRIAQAMVDNSDRVSVKKIEGGKTSVFELTVAKEDLGKIIGKGGRNASAIRTILSSVSAKEGKRSVLEIVEEDQSKPLLSKPVMMVEDSHHRSSFEDLSKESHVGIVKWFSDTRGYGFIRMNNGKEVFVHRLSVKGPDQNLYEGDRVTFEVVETDRGFKAINVTKTDS